MPNSSQAKRALAYAKTVLRQEAKAIAQLEDRLDDEFTHAVALLDQCRGRVVVSGIGKPGFIGQKLSATLASIGVPSLFLHPAEAAHGDLGRVTPDDVVVLLSNSGATEELVRLLPAFETMGVTRIAITGDAKSPLARAADVVVDLGAIDEACPVGLVPTASSAALHAVTDALAMALSHTRGFTAAHYAKLHPGGTLGRSAMTVGELMRRGDALPLVRPEQTLSEVVVVMTNTLGRPGAALVVGAKGELLGLFTDGDLRRLAERRTLDFHAPVKTVMAASPKVVTPELLVLEAARRLRETQVDQLPVVDAQGRAVGLLDVQDVLAGRPVVSTSQRASARTPASSRRASPTASSRRPRRPSP